MSKLYDDEEEKKKRESQSKTGSRSSNGLYARLTGAMQHPQGDITTTPPANPAKKENGLYSRLMNRTAGTQSIGNAREVGLNQKHNEDRRKKEEPSVKPVASGNLTNTQAAKLNSEFKTLTPEEVTELRSKTNYFETGKKYGAAARAEAIKKTTPSEEDVIGMRDYASSKRYDEALKLAIKNKGLNEEEAQRVMAENPSIPYEAYKNYFMENNPYNNSPAGKMLQKYHQGGEAIDKAASKYANAMVNRDLKSAEERADRATTYEYEQSRIRNQEDFLENNQYDTEKAYLGNEDYDAVNNNLDAGTISNQLYEGSHLTMEQRQNYNYVYNKAYDEEYANADQWTSDEAEKERRAAEAAREAGQNYLDMIHADEARTDYFNEFAREYAEEHPIAATATSIALQPFKVAGQIDNTLNFIAGRANDEISLANLSSQMSGTMRGTVRNNIDGDINIPIINKKVHINKNVAKYLYDVGTSMGDMAVSHSLGLGSNNATLGIMGASAANDTYTQLMEAGYSATDATVLSTIAGGAEILTEKIPLDEIFSTDKAGFRQMLRAAFSEGAEEVASDVINDVADIVYLDLIKGGESQFDREVQAYMVKGMSEYDARMAVINDHLNQAVYDFAAGAGSGGAINAMNSVANKAQIEYNQAQAAYRLNDDAKNVLLDLAKTSSDVKTQKMAERVLNKSDKEGNIFSKATNAYDTSKVIKRVIEENDIDNQIDKDLKANGVKNTEEVKNVIYKAIGGLDLTEAEEKVYQSEPVQKELSNIADGKLDATYERQIAVNEALEMARNGGKTVQTQNTETTENGAEIKAAEDNSKKVIPISYYAQNAQMNMPTMAINSMDDIANVTTDSEGRVMIETKDGQRHYNPYSNNKFLNNVMHAATVRFNEGNAAKSFIENYKPGIGLDVYNDITNRMIRAGRADESVSAVVNELKNDRGIIGQVVNQLPVSFLNDMYTYGVNEEKIHSSIVASKEEQNFVNAVGKMFGVNVQVTDENTNWNGKLDKGSNTIYLSKHADKALKSVLAHELTHYFKTRTKSYDKFEKAVIDYMKESGNYNSLVEEYKKAGYSEDEINEEIVSDAPEMFFGDKKFAETVCKTDKNLAQQIMSWLKDTIIKLKKLFGDTQPRTSAARALQQNISKYEEIRDMWYEMFEEVQKADKSAKAADVLQGKGKVKNSLKNLSNAELEASYDDALKDNNLELADRIVEQYAANKGYTDRLYHGTMDFGFTKLDASKGDDGFSFFATNKPSIASSYSGVEGKRGIAEDVSVSDDELYDFLKRRMHFKNIREFKTNDKKARYDFLNEKVKRLNDFVLRNYQRMNEDNLMDAYKEFYRTLTDGILFNNIDYKTVNQKMKPLKEAKFVLSDYVWELQNALLLTRESNLKKHAFILDGVLKTAEDVRDQYVPLESWGNYELYANPENMLEIDGRGDNWSDIRVKKQLETVKHTTEELIEELKNSILGKNKKITYIPEKDSFKVGHWEYERDYVEGVLYPSYEIEHMNTRQIAQMAKEQGYKGVIIRNIFDDGGRNWSEDHITEHGDIYIFFNPENQCKSADTVTYDDQGNVIPLSERFKKDNNDIRFSMKQPVERVRDLVAVHNLSEDKFLKTLKLGGFPMPSIAVTKDTMGWDNFGNISVLFGSDTINPSSNKKNKVYGADAWTPVVPNIEYEIDTQKIRDFADELRSNFDNLSEEYRRGVENFVNYLEYSMDSLGGVEGAIERYIDDKDVANYFLSLSGEALKPIEKVTETKMAEGEIAEAKYIIDGLKGYDIPALAKLPGKEILEKCGTELKKALEKYFVEISDGKIDAAFAKEVVDSMKGLELVRALRIARDYIETKGVKKETSIDLQREAILNKVDKKAYKEWLREKITPLIKDSGIYNGKDIYTPSGNRRAFNQTHMPLTAENLVKAMMTKDQRFASAFFNGIKGIRSVATDEFKTLKKIIDAEGKLENISEDEFNRLNDELDDRLSKVMRSVIDKSKSEYSFGDMDNLGVDIIEACENPTKANLEKVLDKYGWKASEKDIKELYDIITITRNMPVKMFEAKPQRVVNFDEIKTVILPDNTSNELKTALDERNIPYEEYKAGDEADRLAKLNSHDEVKFSIKQLPNGRNYVDIDTEQAKFEGLSLKEKKKLAKEIIDKKYKGKIIKDSSYPIVGGKTLGKEYAYADKRYYTEEAKNDKMRASTELENLLEVSEYIDTAPYSEVKDTHPEAVNGISHYKTIFKVGDNFYTGIINIKNCKNVRVYYDVTKIKRTPESELIANDSNPAPGVLNIEDDKTSSNNNIPSSEQNVNKSEEKESKKSLDNQGRKLSENQQKFFAESKAVDENGNLKVLYHGSSSYGFTIFDTNLSDDKRSLFFTDNRDMARTYVGDNDKIYSVYLNITNPFIVHGNGAKWDKLKLDRDIEKAKVLDKDMRVLNAMENYVSLARNYDNQIDKYLLFESLGGLTDSTEYILNQIEEDGGTIDEWFTKEEVEKLREYAAIIDEAYDSWDESQHLDLYGDEMSFEQFYKAEEMEIPEYRTREIAQIAMNEGYDGVIFEDINDNGDYGAGNTGDVYIAFNSNQVKSVDNLNPTDDPDIRYSKKMLDDIGVKLSNKYSDADEMFFTEDTWENSEAQNSAKNTADILKEGFNDLQKLKEAGKAHFTHADALRLAEKYQREYGTSTGKEYIANNIESIFAYIENNRDNVRYDDMLRVMRDAAMPIVEKQSNELVEYDDFRKYVKDLNISLNDQQRAEVINTYGSMKTFRKAIGSRINITDNGQNIDSLWQDICEASGYYLDPDENSNTQILALADALDSMRDIGDNSGMSTSDKAYDLALNIYTDYFKLNGVENVTKQMKKQIEDYKTASEKMYKQILDNQKKESKAELDRLRNELKLVEADRARLAAAKTLDTDELEHYDMLLKMERKQSANYEETLAQYDKYLDKQRKRILKLKADIEQGKIDRKSARLKAAESRQKTVLRNRIKSIVHNLSKMVTNPTEGSHVPVGLVNATIDVLQTIDLNTGKSVNMAEKLRKLSDKYQAIQKGYEDNVNPDYDATLEAMINQLRKTFEGRSIAKLTQSELEEVFKICAALQTQIRNTNKLINTQLKEDIYEAGQSIIDDVRASKGANSGFINNYLTTSLNAERFFNRISGYKDDSTLNKLYEELNEGSHKMMEIEFEVSDIMKDVLEGSENQKLADKFKGDSLKDWVDTPFKDKNGNTIRVPQSFRASLALHMMNEQNLKHILYGGLTLPNEKLYHQGKIVDAYARGNIIRPAETQQMREIYKQIRNTETVDERIELWKKYNELQVEAEKVGLAKLQDMVNSMTPYEKAWVENAKKYFHEYSGKKINETSLKLNGYAKAVVDNYFPIKSDPSFTRSEMEGLKLDSTIEGWGNLKERVNGSNPIVLEGLDNVLNGHSKMLAKYAGMAIPIRNFNKVYNVTLAKNADSVKKAIKEKFGERSNKFISDLFIDLQMGRPQTMKGFSTLRGAHAASTLTLNIPVTYSQAASYPTAAAELGWDALGHALGSKAGANWAKEFVTFFNLSRTTQDIMATAEKYTPLLKYRNLGNSTQELGDLKNKRTWIQKKSKVADKVIEKSTNWIQNMDVTTVATLWKASEYRVAKDNPNLQPGTDEFYKEVAKVFNKVVERTQPNYTVLQRPDILRSNNELIKFLTMYKTQPLQNLGILIDSTGNLNAKARAYKADPTAENEAKYKKAKKQFARAVSSQVVAACTFVGMRTIANAILHRLNPFRDDDDELTLESIMKKYWQDVGSSMAGSLIGGAEIYDYMNALINKKRWYGLDVSVAENLTNIGNDIYNLYNADTLSEQKAKLKKLITDTSVLTGVPVGNMEKLYDAFRLHAEDIKNGEFLSFEAGVDRSTKVENHRMYEAMKEGDWDKFDKIYADMPYDKVTEGTSSVTSLIKEDYMNGDISYNTALEYLEEIDFGSKKAIDKVEDWISDAYSKEKITSEEAKEKYSEMGYTDAEIDEKMKSLNEAHIKNTFINGQISSKEASKLLKEEGFTAEEIDKNINKWESDIIKTDYNDGRINEEEALKRLSEKGISENDAHFMVQSWETGSTTPYIKVYDAISSYNTSDIVNEVRIMKKYGYDNEKLQKTQNITKQYKDKYIELYNTNKTEAANLKSAILTYYQACGKSREEASKKVDNWVK